MQLLRSDGSCFPPPFKKEDPQDVLLSNSRLADLFLLLPVKLQMK